MMANKTIATKCGERLRRVRQALGMSQEELANRMYISPQAISKYEKNGISDIDVIKKLSDVLGQDLLSDEIDAEGEVGEIGREILIQLINHCGYILYEELAQKYMYGMSDERISTEIFKLQKIGLCVREQYRRWDKSIVDALFVTAKGTISYKNFVKENASCVTLLLKDVQTYEMLTGESSSYQDYLVKHEEIALIEELVSIKHSHRQDYKAYLYENYVPKLGMQRKIYPTKTKCTAYYDIAIRDALNIGQDMELYFYDLIDERDYYTSKEPIIERALQRLYEDYPESKSRIEQEYHAMLDEATERLEDDTITPQDADIDSKMIHMDNFEEYMRHAYEIERVHHDDPNPLNWVTIDTVKYYIQKNMSKTEECKQCPGYEMMERIDFLCRRLNELLPETLEYYTFPSKWEEAGIGDMVRNLYGISTNHR